MANSKIWYNDDIKKGIDDLPISSNVLEAYDNVTYNAALYIFDMETEKKVAEEFAKNSNFNIKQYDKVIIAQTGVTTKYTIRSFSLNSVFANINDEPNMRFTKISMKIDEVLGCNFTNAYNFITKIFGYETYFAVPIWFEIWFSGYDHSGKPIEKIPLPNGYDSIIIPAVFGDMKSDINQMGTEYNVEIVPMYKSIINKQYNILSAESPIKYNIGIKLKDFMNLHAENIFDKFIESFEDVAQNKEKVKNEYGGNYQNYINIILKDENGNDFKEDIILESNIGNITDENGTSEYKTSVTDTFTNICQKFLYHSVKHKHYHVRYKIDSNYFKSMYNRPLFKHTITLSLIPNEIIKETINAFKSSTGKSLNYNIKNIENTKTEDFYKSVKNKTLLKKYQYAFSGEDTSIIEISNKQELLYYIPAITSDIAVSLNSNIKNVIKEMKLNIVNENTSLYYPEKINRDILLEDFYSDLKEKYQVFSEMPRIIKFNDNKENEELKNSSSDDAKYDKEALMYMTLYKRFYMSGGLSTINLTIYGDPYWIAINGGNNTNDKSNEMPDALRSMDNFKFIFTLKTCPEQANGNPYDYTFENSMYISGIYFATECTSNFEDGKFTQTLSGVIDNSLIRSEILDF